MILITITTPYTIFHMNFLIHRETLLSFKKTRIFLKIFQPCVYIELEY